jgi:hypothetical protein
LIKSQATGLYIRFEGRIPIAGAKLIVGSRDDAAVWDIIPDNTPEYKYDDTVLSSIHSKFDFI